MGNLNPDRSYNQEDSDDFTRKIESAEERLEGMRDALTMQDPKVWEVFQEISTLLEELHIARDELRNTNDHLQAAQNMIASERERYRELFDFAPDGYLETDAYGKILEANLEAAEIFNVPPQYLAGKVLANFIYYEDRQVFREKLSSLGQAGKGSEDQRYKWEIRVHPRGQDPIYSALTAAVFHKAGQLDEEQTLIRWMMRDITERKQAQKALQNSKDELEKRVAERTAQLRKANARLRNIAHELELRNRELDEFAVAASHDLKEPLRKIRAFGERLAAEYRPILGHEGLLYLDRMVRASQRMDQMIESLLEYARITSKEMPFQRIDLNKIAQEVAADLEESARRTEGGVEIGKLPAFEANPVQMRQLLQNLISNGLKFHKPGVPPVVKVSGRLLTAADQELPAPSEDQAGVQRENRDQTSGELSDLLIARPYVEIRVEDNGIGIEEHAAKRAYQPFQRLVGRGEFDGTGMGLAICKRIVERHSGTIEAHSILGEGTQFIVKLPARQPAEPGKKDADLDDPTVQRPSEN